MGTSNKTQPAKRRYERICITHGKQLADYTALDDGRVIEMRCGEPGCTFRHTFEVRWPDAFPRPLAPLG